MAHGDHTPTLRSGLELSHGDHTPTLRLDPLVYRPALARPYKDGVVVLRMISSRLGSRLGRLDQPVLSSKTFSYSYYTVMSVTPRFISRY